MVPSVWRFPASTVLPASDAGHVPVCTPVRAGRRCFGMRHWAGRSLSCDALVPLYLGIAPVVRRGLLSGFRFVSFRPVFCSGSAAPTKVTRFCPRR